jgi:hypothetical protein
MTKLEQPQRNWKEEIDEVLNLELKMSQNLGNTSFWSIQSNLSYWASHNWHSQSRLVKSFLWIQIWARSDFWGLRYELVLSPNHLEAFDWKTDDETRDRWWRWRNIYGLLSRPSHNRSKGSCSLKRLTRWAQLSFLSHQVHFNLKSSSSGDKRRW